MFDGGRKPKMVRRAHHPSGSSILTVLRTILSEVEEEHIRLRFLQQAQDTSPKDTERSRSAVFALSEIERANHPELSRGTANRKR